MGHASVQHEGGQKSPGQGGWVVLAAAVQGELVQIVAELNCDGLGYFLG